MEARSGRDGPSVWLTAGIHGDEIGGVVVVQEIFARLRKRPLLAGRLSGFPLLNPFGFETASRRIPSTQEDLNRAFPGDPDGTLAERIAHLACTRIREDSADLVLDLHNGWLRSIPYVVIDPRPRSPAGRLAHERARAAARSTSLPIVAEPSDPAARGIARTTLTGFLVDAGIPALTLELGAAGTVEETSVQSAADTVWSILAGLDMVSPTETRFGAAAKRDRLDRPLRYEHRPCPSTAGIVRFRVLPGAEVMKGTPLASIHNVFGRRVELLRAESDVLVLGFSDSALAMPGLPIVALARRDRPPKAHLDG